VWLADGVCSGDCSPAEKALSEYANQHRTCEVDADCTIASSSCALTSHHCSGAFAVNHEVDATAWAELDAALASCASQHGGSWDCATCDSVPPPARCVGAACLFVVE
jgi:hypothetical protein